MVLRAETRPPGSPWWWCPWRPGKLPERWRCRLLWWSGGRWVCWASCWETQKLRRWTGRQHPRHSQLLWTKTRTVFIWYCNFFLYITTIENNSLFWIYFKMHFCDAKLNFQHHYSIITVSRDPSKIILICWYAAQETFLIIFSVKNICCLIFSENCSPLFGE